MIVRAQNITFGIGMPDDLRRRIYQRAKTLFTQTKFFFGFLLFATTVALFSFYMLAELPKLQRTVLSSMPEEQQRHAMRIWDVD